MVSRHTAHSSSDWLTAFRFGIAVLTTARGRKIPEHFDDDDRAAFLAVAERAADEAVNVYTIVALGAGAYVASMQFAEGG